jgi:hypothetical protein
MLEHIRWLRLKHNIRNRFSREWHTVLEHTATAHSTRAHSHGTQYSSTQPWHTVLEHTAMAHSTQAHSHGTRYSSTQPWHTVLEHTAMAHRTRDIRGTRRIARRGAHRGSMSLQMGWCGSMSIRARRVNWLTKGNPTRHSPRYPPRAPPRRPPRHPPRHVLTQCLREVTRWELQLLHRGLIPFDIASEVIEHKLNFNGPDVIIIYIANKFGCIVM